MVALGIALGVLVAGGLFLVVWLVLRQMLAPLAVSSRARAAIHDIERQTIHAMLVAELSAQRANHANQRRLEQP